MFQTEVTEAVDNALDEKVKYKIVRPITDWQPNSFSFFKPVSMLD